MTLSAVLHGAHRYRVHSLIAFVLFALVFTAWLSVPLSSAWAGIAAYSCLFYAIYLSNRYFDYEEDAISQKGEEGRELWLLFVSLGLYLVGALLILFSSGPLLPYLLLGPVMSLYHYPLGKGGWRVKKVLLLKNLFAAVVIWYLPLCLILAFHSGLTVSFTTVALHLSYLILFILVFELLIDIRDIEGDRAVGIRTVANTLGLPGTRALIGLLLALIVLMTPEAHPLFYANLVFLALAALFATPSRGLWFYNGAIYIQIVFLVLMLTFVA